jgi:hypothetical protein
MSVNLSTPVERTARNESLAEIVVWTVADAKDVDPMDIDEPLYETIDPDALERLFEGASAGQSKQRIEFTLAGCDVTVYGDRRVVVQPPADTETAPTASAVSPD